LSTEPNWEGENLIQTVVTLTGLPEKTVRREIDRILELTGESLDQLTLDKLRAALVTYLERSAFLN
jgi:hypothetical protein